MEAAGRLKNKQRCAHKQSSSDHLIFFNRFLPFSSPERFLSPGFFSRPLLPTFSSPESARALAPPRRVSSSRWWLPEQLMRRGELEWRRWPARPERQRPARPRGATTARPERHHRDARRRPELEWRRWLAQPKRRWFALPRGTAAARPERRLSGFVRCKGRGGTAAAEDRGRAQQRTQEQRAAAATPGSRAEQLGGRHLVEMEVPWTTPALPRRTKARAIRQKAAGGGGLL